MVVKAQKPVAGGKNRKPIPKSGSITQPFNPNVGGYSNPAPPAAIARPSATQSSRPSAQSSYSSGGGFPIGGGGMPGGDMGGMAPAVAAPSEEDYLAGDGSFQAQLAALKGALERYTADASLQRTNYQTDYGSSLRDLGYTEGLNGAPGQWNWNDQNTASGKAYQQQLNDFASRNMLQSQGYADAASDLERQLNQQYGQIATNKTNFMTDLDRQLANYSGENTSAVNAARAEAIARRAAQYGM